MTIYVDARCLQDENYAFRGVGYHSSTLLKAGRGLLADDTALVGLIDSSLPSLATVYSELFDHITPWQAASQPEQGSAFIQLSPMTHDQAVGGRFLDRRGILTASVVYDFIPLELPERYLSNPESLRAYAQAMLWLESYDLFFPISKYSEQRLLESTACAAEDSHVTGVTLRDDFAQIYMSRSRHRQQAVSRSSAADLPVPSPYFLFVGGADARKNIDVLLKAHAQLKQKTSLVVVGNYPATALPGIFEAYRGYGGDPKRLHMRHGISDRQLANWYCAAVASVCSSHIEGFSLPVIEAIACGSPTLVSDIDAHRELVENPTQRFSPEDASRLQSLMELALTDNEFRQSVRDDQQTVPARFLAEAVGRKFWQPIAQGMQRLRAQPANGWFNKVSRDSKPSIAILTPFPPDRSGVADYSHRTIEALAPYVDVDVFSDVQQPLANSAARQFYPITDWAYLSGGYDRVLSVVGNSHFHTKIIDLQRKYGGACLIHDNRLAELYRWWKGPEYFRHMASESLGRHVSLEESEGWIRHPGTLPGVFFDELIESANPLIVHSRGIQRQVEKQYGKPAAYLPFCCYREFSEAQLVAPAKQAARAALGISAESVMVITLGMVTPSKGPMQCIDAVAATRRAGYPVEFYFVGSSDGLRAQLVDHAKSLGILAAIHFSDEWVSETQYQQYLVAADLAIQLRDSFFGGLSGALLDCIASGLPTIANDDLAEALESPDYVLRIGDQMRSEELSAALLRGIETQLHRERLSPSRQAYQSDHSFEAYALEMMRLLGLGKPRSSAIGQIHAA